MTPSEASGYLPGDPRYGLSGDALRRYYSEKPAQWVIFAWDRVGQAGVRAANIAAQKHYAKALGERLVGYGHIVSDDASATLATTWFVRLDDRAAAEAFVENDPLNRAGVYEKTEIRRWSNSFLNCLTTRRPRNSGTASLSLQTAAIRTTRGSIAGHSATDRSQIRATRHAG